MIAMIAQDAGQPVADALPQLDQRIAAQAATLLHEWSYAHPSEIWEELRRVTPAFYGITYERLERESGVHWPCPSLDYPGRP